EGRFVMAGRHEQLDPQQDPNDARRDVLGVPSPVPAPPTIDWSVLTPADARDRALRSLIYGVLLSAVWGAVSVAGSLVGINFFSKDGLIAGLTIVGAAVGHSILSYLGRIKWTPPASTMPVK